MMELWRPVPDYEGLYEVSNTGKVDQLARYIYRKGQKPYHARVRLKQSSDYYGYKSVRLAKDGVEKRYLVHRLVGVAFIPNPDGLPIMNHKDENPGNNHVDNLEWCDHKYNARYGKRNERLRRSSKRNREKRANNPLVRKDGTSRPLHM